MVLREQSLGLEAFHKEVRREECDFASFFFFFFVKK